MIILEGNVYEKTYQFKNILDVEVTKFSNLLLYKVFLRGSIFEPFGSIESLWKKTLSECLGLFLEWIKSVGIFRNVKFPLQQNS